MKKESYLRFRQKPFSYKVRNSESFENLSETLSAILHPYSVKTYEEGFFFFFENHIFLEIYQIL